jgi:hypothetical protein
MMDDDEDEGGKDMVTKHRNPTHRIWGNGKHTLTSNGKQKGNTKDTKRKTKRKTQRTTKQVPNKNKGGAMKGGNKEEQ